MCKITPRPACDLAGHVRQGADMGLRLFAQAFGLATRGGDGREDGESQGRAYSPAIDSFSETGTWWSTRSFRA